MVERIERYKGLAEIIIVDNGSTYGPLLEWYAKTSHTIVRLENIGHKAPWEARVARSIKTDFYVVSDPDLDIAATPDDTLIYLAKLLMKYPQLGKVGLGLRIDDVPRSSPYYSHVTSYEAKFWNLPLLAGELRMAPLDTTFAVYHKHVMNEYKWCGARATHPYSARHLPWSVVAPDEEFKYYLSNANSSCSYKSFLAKLERNPAASAFGGSANNQALRRNDPCPCGSGLRYKHCHGSLR